jgi:hypothetical protein
MSKVIVRMGGAVGRPGYMTTGGDSMEKLINARAPATKLGGLSIWTLRMWARQGKLKRIKVGHRTMFRESDLERFVESQNPTDGK